MAFAVANYNRVREPEIIYHQGKYYNVSSGRFAGSSLQAPIGVNDLGGWFKRLKRVLKKTVKATAKIVTAPIRATVALVKGDFKDAAGIVVAPWAGSKATRGRILRRAGGVVAGAITGVLTLNPVSAIVGGVTGGIMAKKGVKGIKGYGKIALVGAAAGGAASAVVGAAAQTGFSTGLLSQATAQKAILASGKAGMWGAGVAAGAPIPIVSGLTAKGVVGTVSLAKGIVGMIAPKASPTDMATQEQVQQAQQAAYGESYMDLLRQTSGVNPDTSGMYSQSRVNGQTWGGGEGQYMPSPTGSGFPGQDEGTQVEYEPETGIAKRELFPGLDKNMLLIIGGVGLLAMIAYKKQ